MKNIFLIICLLLYSTNLFSNTSSSDSNEKKYIQEENNHTQIAFGLGALIRALSKIGSKSGNILDNIPFPKRSKIGDDIPFPKTPKFTPIKKSSFDWGFNPNPSVIRKGLEELLETDPEGYQELSEWDCPEKIVNAPFLQDLPEKDRCVSYHMRCNVVVETNKAMGSGFFYNSRIIITNYHVVDKDSSSVKIEPFVSDKKYKGEVIAVDKLNDFAAIELEPYNNSEYSSFLESILNIFQPCFLAKESPDVGANVVAIGHPQGRKFYLSKGYLKSYRDRYFEKININNKNLHWIEMNAYIAPGSSGGPLYHQGYVIGVNTRGIQKTKENYAMHFIKLKNFLNYNEIESNFQKFSFDKDNTVKKLKLVIK
jgi:S1-C subfamily serine protease